MDDRTTLKAIPVKQNTIKRKIKKRLTAGRPTIAETQARQEEGNIHSQAKITPLFILNRNATGQIIINRGGARSSKSYSIAQLLVDYFFTMPKIKILILRKTQPSLRLSCMVLVKEIIMEYNLWQRIRDVKVERSLYSPVEGWIHFGGLDDPEKIKSTDWNIIWMEEATEFEYNDFINLKLRLSSPIPVPNFRNRLFMSFNPIDEYHWIKTKIIDEKTEDYTEIQSNYRFNPFLHPDYVHTVEELEHQDYNSYRIFTLGEWGRLEHLIFKNWRMVHDIPTAGETIFGLDFGFINPSALVKVNVDGIVMGIEELLYESGLTNSQLIERMNVLITPEQKRDCMIFADCAEPARIEEIANAGFNIYPSDKSVLDGIDYMSRCDMQVKEDSDHVVKELRGYSRKTDKHTGQVTEEPIKFNDHMIDAIRYACYTYWVQYCKTMGLDIRSTSEEIKAGGKVYGDIDDEQKIDYTERKGLNPFDMTSNLIREVRRDYDDW